MQKNQNLTVNFHFAPFCNMSCRYCFVEKAGVLSTNDYVKVIDKLAKYFTRINFVGGEPTCSSSLLSFVKKSKSLGLDCTMVTNGFELIHNEGKFLELYSLMSCIGISIDSLKDDTNRSIGRLCGNQVITRNEYERLCKMIKSHGLCLKINTVVSKLNLHENFSDFYKKVNPHRIKLFQVLKPNLELKHPYDDLLISKEDFNQFVKRHIVSNQRIIVEDNNAMTNAYFILDSECRFVDNKTGVKSPSLAKSSISVEEALAYIKMDYAKYQSRYSA